MTFSELKQKDVINVCDGRKLGKPVDLVLNASACVDALIVPAPGNLLNLLKQDKEGFLVPWEPIRRIGDDVILVEVQEEECVNMEGNS